MQRKQACLHHADLLNSSFHGFKYKHDFGLFKTKFTSKDLVAVNVIAVLPSVLIGIGGGVLGSAFTHVNLIFAKWRKEYMAKVKSKACSNLIRLLEPICILTIMTTIHVFLPQILINGQGCTEVDCTYSTSSSNDTTPDDTYSGPKVYISIFVSI